MTSATFSGVLDSLLSPYNCHLTYLSIHTFWPLSLDVIYELTLSSWSTRHRQHLTSSCLGSGVASVTFRHDSILVDPIP